MKSVIRSHPPKLYYELLNKGRSTRERVRQNERKSWRNKIWNYERDCESMKYLHMKGGREEEESEALKRDWQWVREE